MAQSWWCINIGYAATRVICICLALWTVCWAIIQIGVFSWQISVIRADSSLIQNLHKTAAESDSLTTALDVMHIINIILSIILFITGLGFTYCLWRDSKLADLPWAASFALSILGIIIWCIIWWASGVGDYWLMLTVVEFLFSCFNASCLIYAAILHRRFIPV